MIDHARVSSGFFVGAKLNMQIGIGLNGEVAHMQVLKCIELCFILDVTSFFSELKMQTYKFSCTN